MTTRRWQSRSCSRMVAGKASAEVGPAAMRLLVSLLAKAIAPKLGLRAEEVRREKEVPAKPPPPPKPPRPSTPQPSSPKPFQTPRPRQSSRHLPWWRRVAEALAVMLLTCVAGSVCQRALPAAAVLGYAVSSGRPGWAVLLVATMPAALGGSTGVFALRGAEDRR